MQAVLCRLADLAPGSARGFDPWHEGQDTMFVVRREGGVRAWRNDCPHMPGAPLAWRKDAYLSVDGRSIVCYGHGATFDLDTGQCITGPCMGQALSAVAVHVTAGGEIWLTTEPSPKLDPAPEQQASACPSPHNPSPTD